MAKNKKATLDVKAPVDAKDVASNIVKMPVSQYLRKNNYAYMVYTNTDRAIPLVSSGVKPGAQRLLYSMMQDGVLPDASPQKSAKLTSSATGNYHPHGQSAMYGTLATLASDYGRLKLIEGIGSFGMTPGDTPAADRYTEARLDEVGYDIVREVKDGATPMRATYDNKRQEPWYLPSTYPVLLMMGAMGIGEGWSTNTPAHNPREVIAAVKLVLENPDATTDDILEVMPGPDWGTGGTIIGDISGIKEYYETGRGKLTVRANYTITNKKIRFTEIPPGVLVPTLIEGKKKGDKPRPGLNDLVRQGVIAGVSDTADHSDLDKGLAIDVIVKRGHTPESVLEELFRHTDLETTYAASIVALDNDLTPRWWSVRELIDSFIELRDGVIINRSLHELKNLDDKLLRQQAIAVIALDKESVARILLDSDDKQTAKQQLLDKEFVIDKKHQELFEGRGSFILNEEQAEYVVNMPMYRLTKADTLEALSNLQKTLDRIEYLETIVQDNDIRRGIISEELDETLKLFDDPWYDRRTVIDETINPVSRAEDMPDDEKLRTLWKLDTELHILGEKGRVIPDGHLVWAGFSDGKVKMFEGGGLPGTIVDKPIAPKVDEVIASGVINPETQDIVFVTRGKNKQNTAKILRLDPTGVSVQGIAGNGVAGIKILEGDEIVSVMSVNKADQLLIMSETSHKVVPVSEIPYKGRGAQGVGVFKLAGKDGGVIAVEHGPGFTVNGKDPKVGAYQSTPVRKVAESFEKLKVSDVQTT